MATPPNYTLAQAPTFDMGLVLSGTAVNTAQATSDFYTQNFKGVTVILDVTSYGGSTVTVVIEGKDSASGQYFPLLTSGNLTTKRTTSHTIYPGITPGNSADSASAVSGILPAVFRVRVTTTGTVTYTVGAVLTT